MQYDYIGSTSDQNQYFNNRTEAFIKCIKQAAEKVRFVQRAEMSCCEIRAVMKIDDKKSLWDVLQKYLRMNMEFINSMKDLTGVYIYPVDEKFYEAVTVVEIKHQLQMLIGYIYAKEAIHSRVKSSFKQCLKNLLEGCGCFSKKDLKVIDIYIGN